MIQRYIGLASNPWITNEIPQAQTKARKHEGRGNTAPKIPNRLSLIQEDDTWVASSVVKTAKATRPASTSAAKHPLRASA